MKDLFNQDVRQSFPFFGVVIKKSHKVICCIE